MGSNPSNKVATVLRDDDHQLSDLFKYLNNDKRKLLIADAIREAIDAVLDGIVTDRVDISSQDVDKVEKTFLGFKVEHFIRHHLELPHGKIFDIAWKNPRTKMTIEFDIKWSIRRSYMIPQEAVRERAICLLVSADDRKSTYEAGLIRVEPRMLNGENQDQKRSLKAKCRDTETMWIAKDGEMPENVLLALEEEDPAFFRELMTMKPGQKRLDYFATKVKHRPFTNATLNTLTGQRDNQRRTRQDKNRPETLTYRILKPGSHMENVPAGVKKPRTGYMIIV